MSVPAEEPGNPAHAIFERFLRAGECQEVLGSFLELCQQLGLQGSGLQLYHGLKAALNYWNAKALWSKLDKKAGHKDYDQGTACAGTKVSGVSPWHGATSVPPQCHPASSVLPPPSCLSLGTSHGRAEGAVRSFLGDRSIPSRMCPRGYNPNPVPQMMALVLTAAALSLGTLMTTPLPAGGWQAVLQPSSSPLSHYEFDVLISAGGGKFVPEGFKRKETRGKLAIGITTNFINRHSRAEVEVAEISGVARIYNQKFFQNLYNKTGIDLENIVYYKDDTHYFVMTAKKQSLLTKGVILQDKADIESLLAPDNVNRDALLSYAKEAANFSTNYCLPELEFALNHRDLPDVDMFDFTCMTRSENAALVREHNGSRVLLGLVGDCLVEPFWPLGTGVARGFLAAFDAAWMVRRWAAGTPPLEVLAERCFPNAVTETCGGQGVSQVAPMGSLSSQSVESEAGGGLGGLSPVSASPVAPGAVSEELLSWCQASTAGYPGVAVTNFSTSWTSGLALCALIHRFRPDLVDFDSVDPQDAVQTHQMLLDVAEQELGIQPVLSSAEMATLTEPDCLDLITYLSHFYQIFGTSPGAKFWGDLSHSELHWGWLGPIKMAMSCAEVEVSKKPLSPPGTRGAILFLSKLQKSRNLAHKRSQVRDSQPDPPGPPKPCHIPQPELPLWGGCQAPGASAACPVPPQPPRDRTGENSDACYFCGRRVYIVERASAEGRFFHRGCFQCRRCGATLRLGDYAFDEEDGNFYCSLHYPNPAGMDLPRDEAPALPDGVNHPNSLWVTEERQNVEGGGWVWPALHRPCALALLQDADAAAHAPSDAGRSCVSPMEWAPSPLQPAPAAPQAGEEPGHAEDAADAGGTEEEQELLAQPGAGVREEEIPRAEPQGAAEEGEETGGRRKIILTPLEKLSLSTLNLTSEAEPEPPLKPARLRLPAAPEALPALRQGQGACKEEEEEEEEEKIDMEKEASGVAQLCQGTDPPAHATLLSQYPDPREEEKFPTWKRTLARRTRESQMKRFCRAQAIQRRLEEIEVTFRELEQQGTKLEKLLRDENGKARVDRALW
ncbi:MICA3 monooxygenase, partial [Calcarius ornatus]|nr:MICA3 monooxygenase [Calcarius ornatus]